MMEAKNGKKREVKELADESGVTRAAIYNAIKRGHIPATQFGSIYRLSEEAFRYHAENGWGKNIPPYGSTELAE